MTTLIEFLHPLRQASRTTQVQAALYYCKHYRRLDEGVTVAQVRDALIEARMPGAKKANLPQALRNSAPYARSLSHGVWEITSTGVERIRDELTLPAHVAEPEHDVASLKTVAATVKDRAVRDYVDEAVKRLRVDARRASVVFPWTGAVATIREDVWRFGPRSVEAALKVHNPKAKFRKKGDFEGVKDADLLQIAHDMEIYDKSQKKRLNEALDLRNDCGHPVKYKPGEKKVASFVEDLVATVWP